MKRNISKRLRPQAGGLRSLALLIGIAALAAVIELRNTSKKPKNTSRISQNTIKTPLSIRQSCRNIRLQQKQKPRRFKTLSIPMRREIG